MDRRKLKSYNKLNLGTASAAGDSNPNSQIVSRTASLGFRPIIPSNKRKKSPSPEPNIAEKSKSDFSLEKNLTSKKRRSEPDDENAGRQNSQQIETNRAPSRLSDFGSQASTKSRCSIMSQLAYRSKQKQNNLIANASKKTPEKSGPAEKTPVKNVSQNSVWHSLSPNTSEFEKALNKSDSDSSPVGKSSKSDSDGRKRVLEQLTTPSKDDGSESGKSLFSSGSSSAKKRGKLSLRTPNDKSDKEETTPAKAANVSRRILDGDDSSILRGQIFSSTRNDDINKASTLFSSPQRPARNPVEFSTPRPVRTKNNKFILFLNAGEVILMEGENPHQINGDPNDVKDNLRKLLNSKDQKYPKPEIIQGWKNFIDNENNLKKATQDLKVIHDGLPFPAWYNTSLIKLLLQISEIQKPVLESLLQKLMEVILEANDEESVSWIFTVIQQIRFLEFIVDPESLTASIENLLESIPMWCLKDLILFLPDIIVDSQHHAISEILLKLLEYRSELMNVILDTLSTLSIGKMHYEELRCKLIDKLEGTDACDVPAITRFVLNNCHDEKAAERILQTLRIVHLERLGNSDEAECFTNQMLTVKAIKASMKISKKVLQAAISVIKTSHDEAKPMDLIYLFALFTNGSTAQKTAETILKQNIRSGYYRLSLFKTFYNDYLEVARDLEPSTVQLASILLKSDDRLYAELGVEWFILIFMSRTEVFQQRIILEKILQLVGYNNSTAKRVFTILSKMTGDDEKRKCLQSQCIVLNILLEKMDNLDLESAAILSDVLHGLCIQTSSMADTLNDDLNILMQKQLASAKLITKCKGVMSACMAIKHFAKKSETWKKAVEIFERVKTSVEICPRSRALFYDRMSLIVSETDNFDNQFLKYVKSFAEENLVRHFHTEDSISSDMEVKFGLNKPTEGESELIVKFGDGKFGGVIPVLLRLLRMSCMRLPEDEGLNEINGLLGCSFLLPRDLDEPEPRVLDSMIYCINWFRESISGFVRESDSLMQRQVLKRLDDLMKMQGEFQMLLSMCDTRYEPPLAYFHYFPSKPFVKIEKKSTKKGKKGKKAAADKSHTLTCPEWESFDLGSLLVTKNPTYFRKLDTRIVHLLNVKMDMPTQSTSQAVSIAQVCFVVKELLSMLANDDSESLIQDLINLLPAICTKLSDIVDELKVNEVDDCQLREALDLLLQLINQIFSWKELFNSAKYNNLLRTGLGTIASQTNGMNTTQIATRDLVAEAYKFFEHLSEIAEGRSIILAFHIVNLCGTLMKHSKIFSNENKEKHATLAYVFLQTGDWLDKQKGILYRNAVAGLIKTWIDYEPLPLKKITEIMTWLSNDVELLEKPSDCLKNLPSISKSSFPLLFKKILEGLIKGAKNNLRDTKSDEGKLKIWIDVGAIIAGIRNISKMLKMSTVYLLSVRYMIIILRLFLNQGCTVLEYNLKYQMKSVLKIVHYFQGTARYLHGIYCTGTNNRDTSLAKFFPSIKSIHDDFVCRMKGMMVLNDSLDAFKLGNLVKKDVDGNRIQSQSSMEDSSSIGNDLALISEAETNISQNDFPSFSEAEDKNSNEEIFVDNEANEENSDEEEQEEEEDEDLDLDSI